MLDARYLLRMFDDRLLTLLNERVLKEFPGAPRFVTMKGARTGTGSMFLENNGLTAYVEKQFTTTVLHNMSIQDVYQAAVAAACGAMIMYTPQNLFVAVQQPVRITHNILNLNRIEIVGED